MTREEAIENLKELIDTYITCRGEEDTVAVSLDNVDVEALDMAIKALEQEPSSSEIPNKSEKPTGSDDCISRQDVLSEIIRFSTEEGSSVECQQLYCDVNNMPPSTPIRPKGQWIDHSDEGYVECPMCGSATSCDDNINDLHFCFSCGAEMDGVEECKD